MTRIINNSSDPDISVSEDGAAPTNNIMSTLREELKRKIENKPLTLAIPSREGVSIKFNTNIEAGLIQQWRKRASDKTMPDGFDPLKFACIVLANQAEVVIHQGKEAVGNNKDFINFKNPELLEMLGTERAVDAVRKMYGIDGHILQVVEKLFSAAGYDAETSETDADPF